MPTKKNQTRPVRFVIADDHVLVRELIVQLLSSGAAPMEVVAEADSAEAALRLCQEVQPDILLVDLRLLTSSSVVPVGELRKRLPAVRILLYSGGASDRQIITAMQQGVDGFIGKSDGSREFLEALNRLSRGENYFCARSSRLLAEMASAKQQQERGDSSFSPREKQIVRLIAHGQTSKEIAAALALSVATVDTHRRNAMAKVGARNAADLIRYGYDHGLFSGSDASGNASA